MGAILLEAGPGSRGVTWLPFEGYTLVQSSLRPAGESEAQYQRRPRELTQSQSQADDSGCPALHCSTVVLYRY